MDSILYQLGRPVEGSVVEPYLSKGFDLRGCHPFDEGNVTRMSSLMTEPAILGDNYSRCVNPSYLPRVLSTRQISWRSAPAAPNDTKGGGKASSETDKNGTSKMRDLLNRHNETVGEDGEKQNDVVHKFLAFGLALPKHPYSGEFLTTLKAVAPLFPEVTVIVGNGDEFVDFSQQYNVRSFPKLLVFNWGVLHGRYTAEFDKGYAEEDFVRYFSEWTQSAPAAQLLPHELRTWSGRDDELRVYDDSSKYGDMIRVVPSAVDVGWSGKIALVKSPKGKTRSVYQYFSETLEPVVDQEVDAILYIVSLIFVMYRLLTRRSHG